jgi:hypothetical protein
MEIMRLLKQGFYWLKQPLNGAHQKKEAQQNDRKTEKANLAIFQL